MSPDTLRRRGLKRPIILDPDTSLALEGDRANPATFAPHRPRALILDRLERYDPENLALSAVRDLLPNDPFFEGHFPREPVYPGVALLEMINQAGLCLFHLSGTGGTGGAGAGPGPRLLGIQDAQFHHQASPGARLEIRVRQWEPPTITHLILGQIWSDERLLCCGISELIP